MKNYWVAEVMLENFPKVNLMEMVATEEQALDLVVKLAVVQGAGDSEEAIRAEAEQDGCYRPTKHAEWSICWGLVDVVI